MFGWLNSEKTKMVGPEEALPGRDEPLRVADRHAVHGRPIMPPFPEECRELIVGMGCFWGAEQLFWEMDGVYTTAVGYAGGYTPNPTYEEVCTAKTGHAEVVRIVYDPSRCELEKLLRVFWESHDPTQQMRQGNDVGTQYRSAIYVPDEESLARAGESREAFEAELAKAGMGPVATEIRQGVTFYYAEDWHQQYLNKNPGGYCGLKGTGVACP